VKTVAARFAAGRILSASRAIACVAVGLVAGFAVTLLGVGSLAPLVGWCTAAGTAMAWVWLISWHQDAEGTERLAEDENRSASTDLWVLSAAVASLVAVGLGLQRPSDADGLAVATVLLCVVSVILAWGMVNTVFALKYARLYYLDEPDRQGFDFNQDAQPAYSDFAYMAFTVGMSFAASDARPDAGSSRKVMLGHALLSYLFGTVVIAVAVSLITNLSA
jgi:uncharacterized membrane protein